MQLTQMIALGQSNRDHHGNLSILGSYSASESKGRATQFLSRTLDEFDDFDRILTTRFHLDQVTKAVVGMQGPARDQAGHRADQVELTTTGGSSAQ